MSEKNVIYRLCHIQKCVNTLHRAIEYHIPVFSHKSQNELCSSVIHSMLKLLQDFVIPYPSLVSNPQPFTIALSVTSRKCGFVLVTL
jgi:hypothetical protein